MPESLGKIKIVGVAHYLRNGANLSLGVSKQKRCALKSNKPKICHNARAKVPLMQEAELRHRYQINARWMARWTQFMFDARTSWRLQSAKSGGGIYIGRGSHLIDAVL